MFDCAGFSMGLSVAEALGHSVAEHRLSGAWASVVGGTQA